MGVLALTASLTNVAFITFTSSVPIWLGREHGLAMDNRLIGWTLAFFSLGAGLGSLTGGHLSPRLGWPTVMIGSLLLAAVPIITVLRLQPGSFGFFVAAGLAGMLIYVSSPVTVVVAQDLTPESPAAAYGIVLGVSYALAGAIYVGLGRLQEVIGLTEGMTLGFLMVIPAAILAVVLFLHHPEART